MKRRILICASEYPPLGSGLASVVYNLREAFSKKNHVKVCSPIGPDIKLGSPKALRYFGGIGLLWYWWCVGRYLKKHLHEYDSVLLENPLLLHKIYSPCISVTTHTTYTSYYEHVKDDCGLAYRLLYLFMRRIEKWSYTRLDKRLRFTSASDDVTEEMVKLGIPRKRIVYISNGADVKRFHPINNKERSILRKQYNIENKLTVLFVGRLRHEHQPLEMVKILSAVNKQVPLQFVVVGRGDLEVETKELAKSSGLPVVFISRVEYKKMHEVYQLADCFFMDSLYIGQSLVLLEAMASGLPIVVPRIREFERLVNRSKTGCLFPQKQRAKAVKIISNYLQSGKLKDDKLLARYFALSNLDWNKIGKDYLNSFS